MEFIGMLKKLGEREFDSKNGEGKIRFAEYLCTGLGDRPASIVFDVMDGEKGRIATFDGFNGKLCKVMAKCEARMYNSRYYQSIRAWDIENVTNE